MEGGKLKTIRALGKDHHFPKPWTTNIKIQCVYAYVVGSKCIEGLLMSHIRHPRGKARH